jgi:glycosyltransferase involved in cell wall biosynthesis
MRQKILIRGPILSQSGYGEQARFAMRALRSKEDIFDIFILPVTWGQTGWVSLDNEERKWVDEKIKATHEFTQQGGKFDISVQVTIPNEFQSLAPVNIGYTAGIETTKVAPVWIQKANEMDKIIVVSHHSKEVFKSTSYEGQNPNTGQLIKLECNTPIEVVNYPVRHFKKEKINLNLDYDFNYLAISQWGPRKNFDNLINWFIEENFDQEVGLVLKTSIKNNSIIDREFTEQKLKNIISSHGDIKCKVYLLHGDLSEEQMTSLYQDKKIKCLISTTHGEGYGLPLFEAAYNGLPVICPGWSGQRDFLYIPQKNGKLKPLFASVEYKLKQVQSEAVWEGVIQADSQWAFPIESSFKKRLREVRTENSRFKRNATKLKKYLVENFTEEKMYEAFINAMCSGSTISLETNQAMSDWLEEIGELSET